MRLISLHSGRMGWSDRWRYRAFYLGDAVLAQFADDLEVTPEALPYFLTNKLKDKRLCRKLVTLHVLSQENRSVLQKETELMTALAGLFVRHGSPAPQLHNVGDERTAISEVLEYLSTTTRTALR